MMGWYHAALHGTSGRGSCRHEFLKEMLQARADCTLEGAALAGSSDADLDEMLARTQQELACFRQLNQPPMVPSLAASEFTHPKALTAVHSGPSSTREDISPPMKNSGGGDSSQPGMEDSGGPSVQAWEAGPGNLGGHTHLEIPAAERPPGIPGAALMERMASPEEVRLMVQAAELAASPVAVEEDFGRGKRRRTVGSYKEQGVRSRGD
jgi:hypothetical protein